jgi:hypothetical protein
VQNVFRRSHPAHVGVYGFIVYPIFPRAEEASPAATLSAICQRFVSGPDDREAAEPRSAAYFPIRHTSKVSSTHWPDSVTAEPKQPRTLRLRSGPQYSLIRLACPGTLSFPTRRSMSNAVITPETSEVICKSSNKQRNGIPLADRLRWQSDLVHLPPTLLSFFPDPKQDSQDQREKRRSHPHQGKEGKEGIIT